MKVGVYVGVFVFDGVNVGVLVAVEVGVYVDVGVFDGVRVGVFVGVLLGVRVGVRVGVLLAVNVFVGVNVLVAVGATQLVIATTELNAGLKTVLGGKFWLSNRIRQSTP